MTLKPQGRLDEMNISSDSLLKVSESRNDLFRLFNEVFGNENGQKMLAHIEMRAHYNFPNYDNVYATYSKIGEQTLSEYLKAMTIKAKGKI